MESETIIVIATILTTTGVTFGALRRDVHILREEIKDIRQAIERNRQAIEHNGREISEIKGYINGTERQSHATHNSHAEQVKRA